LRKGGFALHVASIRRIRVRRPRRATSPERARTHTRRVDAEDDARGEEAARAPTAADASAEDAMALLTFAGEAKREMWLCCGGENA